MPYELVHRWLNDSSRKHALLSALTAFGAFLLALFLLALTWYLVFAVAIFLNPRLAAGNWLGVAIPAAVIGLLFWTEARTPQEYFSDISVTPVGSDHVIAIPGVGSNVNPLAGDSINATAKMVSDSLCVGPRVFFGAVKFARQAARLKRLDVDQCAAVLTVLARAGGKQSYQQITDGVEGVDLASTVPALRDIEGVVFLRSEPAGMSLPQDLRDALRNFARENVG